MKLTPTVQEQIDSMSPQALLKTWRFAPLGDPLLQGESGDYIAQRLQRVREEEDWVALSKAVGWD